MTTPTTTVSASEQRTPRNALIGGAVLAAAILALAFTAGTGPLSAPKAIVLGAVEGITEYLPVSSTGHLLVTQRLLGLGNGAGKTAADTYAIAIQLGAIHVVVALYRRRIGQLAAGLIGRDTEGRTLLVRLLVAFIPAAVVGSSVAEGDGVTATPSLWALGRVPLNVAVRPDWQLENTGTRLSRSEHLTSRSTRAAAPVPSPTPARPPSSPASPPI
jgi:hypothetical protein